MRVCVLWNRKAGDGERIAEFRGLFDSRKWTVREPADGEAFAGELIRAADEGFDRVVIAGGDGTIHRAVNVLVNSRRKVPLAILPLGTGNDFARTLGVPLDSPAAAGGIESGRVRHLDAIAVTGDATLTVVNAANGGFAGHVTSNLSDERKQSWGPLAYLREAAGVVADPPRWTIRVRYDGGHEHAYEVINVVIANGRTAGGGMPVAPTADVEDGQLDCLFVLATDALERSVVAARLFAGEYDKEDSVLHRRARDVELWTDPAMPFSLDGEDTAGSHFRFTVIPRAVPFVVGPDYRARPHRFAVGPLGLVFGFLGGVARVVRAVPKAFSVGTFLALTGTAFLILLVAYRGRLAGVNDAILAALGDGRSDAATQLAIWLTWLGGTVGATVVTTLFALAFAGRKRFLDAAVLALVATGAGLTTFVSKQYFADVRPDLAPSPYPADGYSFPSGHAVAAVAVYGTLAALLPRHPRFVRLFGIGFCVAAIAGICWCRPYLGVHRPTDVLAGAMIGGLWVIGGSRVRAAARRRMERVR